MQFRLCSSLLVAPHIVFHYKSISIQSPSRDTGEREGAVGARLGCVAETSETVLRPA